MIPIKTPREIEIMKRAGKILADVLFEVLRNVQLGISEIELDAMAEKLIREKGGEPGFKKVPGYKHTLCVATNDVVVHGIPTNYKLKEGDIIGLDCGVFLEGFHTDMAETVKVKNNNFVIPANAGIYINNSYQQEDKVDRFLRIGKEGMLDGIAQIKPGNRIGHISRAIQQKVEKIGGYSVTRSLIGHGVGRELHEEPEVPGYLVGQIEKTPFLKPGMTIAVEVIYNMGSAEVAYSGNDDWTIKTVDGGFGGLFERTVLVIEKGNIILTER